MAVGLFTDLTKIGLNIKLTPDPDESCLSYNLMCIPLDKNNKLVGNGDYICDFRRTEVKLNNSNENALLALIKENAMTTLVKNTGSQDHFNPDTAEEKNEPTLITLTKNSDLLCHFSLDLRNTPEEVEKLTFFLLGIPTGKLVKGLSSIEIGLTCSDDNTDDNTDDIVALLEIPNLSWGVKCVNLCNFERREDSWVFKEIAKRIKMDDFYCALWD
ncbi:hypothetical protein [Anaerobutyricum hallii]|uniref:hypothetical protein n=1 Tax=Anaerobutyricum hallii TaxID=39488 RepID=UPI0026EC8DC3|nr:hypothetical protein [Anaerobutyricum hallii]